MTHFLLTWVLGLIIPVLLRFVIFRKAIGKGWAVLVSGIILFIQIILFNIIDDKNVNYWLGAVAFISYAVMTNGYENRAHDSEVKDKGGKKDVLKGSNSNALGELGNKKWYRLMRVLYFLGIFVGAVYSFSVAFDDGEIGLFVITFLPIYLIIEVIRRSFYYIYFGTVRPN